ncbi:MAG: thioester domain-containing protein [Phycisphaerales bacterium]
MKMGMMMLVLAAGSSMAMADTVDVRYRSVAGGTDAAKLKVGSHTYYAGHMVHEFTSGNRSGERFSTFCIDLAEAANTSGTTYQIVDLADAPAPGVPYGQAVADRINSIVANAAQLGWIDNKLQADTDQVGYTGKMGAIQAAIWEALDGDIRLGSSRTSDDLAFYYSELMNQQSFDPQARINGLRAIVAQNQQDMLYVVPLPPAALAGAGLLLGIGGLRVARRRS